MLVHEELSSVMVCSRHDCKLYLYTVSRLWYYGCVVPRNCCIKASEGWTAVKVSPRTSRVGFTNFIVLYLGAGRSRNEFLAAKGVPMGGGGGAASLQPPKPPKNEI
jgi:hypothetical protein